MLTGELINKVDSLWEIFWTGGLTNPLVPNEFGCLGVFLHPLLNSGSLHNGVSQRTIDMGAHIFGHIEMIPCEL